MTRRDAIAAIVATNAFSEDVLARMDDAELTRFLHGFTGHRDAMISREDGHHVSRTDGGRDDELAARVNALVDARVAEMRGGRATGPSQRAPDYTGDLVAMLGGHRPAGVGYHDDAHEDARELAELERRFDAAPELLENFHLAEPYRYGTAAAERAAEAAYEQKIRGGR